MNRRRFVHVAAQSLSLAAFARRGGGQPESPAPVGARTVMDMVHFNPGDKPPTSRFLDPEFLASWKYNAEVIQSPIEGVPTFHSIDPTLVPPRTPERAWSEAAATAIQGRVQAAHAAGLKVYAWMQLVVFPKAVVERFRSEICAANGKIDVALPRTQQLIAVQLQEIIERFPLLDGVVIRTGEVYMQDLPYHASTGDSQGTSAIQAGTAILHGAESHLVLLRILRDVVCVHHDRNVFYRTWDFGNNFHTNPAYYLQVTDSIEPHPKLVFSVKHQKGDFHQLTPFNPTLLLGRHRQVVEVQCQREAYGKGAHPYYIGQGVIEGWEDMAWINPPASPKGLEDILTHPLCAGVWTWSRGGGWEGPYIKNELWCALNAYIIAKYAEDPSRKEKHIFASFARAYSLSPGSIRPFRQLCLLSTKAVLRGQLSAIPTQYGDPIHLDVWWARDDKLEAPDLKDFVHRNLVERSLAEKREAVSMWHQIASLSQSVSFADPTDTAFVRSSCTYGLMKYSVIAAGWTAILLAEQGAATGHYEKPRIAAAIARWDHLWAEWRRIAATDPLSSTLVRPQGFDIQFGYKPGMAATLDQLRAL